MEAIVPLLLFVFFILAFIVVLGISVGGTVLWIWMIIDCATNEPSEGNDKIVWILILIFTNWIGALVYLVVRRPQRIRQHGR